MDFGEVGKVETAAGRRKLYCFCAVLGWSRWRYLRFFTCQRFQVLARGLAGCFEAMAGVAAYVICDYVARNIIAVLCPAELLYVAGRACWSSNFAASG